MTYEDYKNDPTNVTKAHLLGSLLDFTRVFYKIRTGRDYNVSEPVGRESHHITICRELTKCKLLQTQRLLINIEPGSGKSELCRHFVAWCMAHYPDSNFLYISYSHDLAADSTYIIKQIMTLPAYKEIFGVEIKHDSSAKDHFQTTAGGNIFASGSAGSITGRDAGLQVTDRFSGAVIIDDIHKPDEVFSDPIRQSVISNFKSTIIHRPRSEVVPIIFIGQRLHEDDMATHLVKGTADVKPWKTVIFKSVDEVGNI